MYGPSGESKGSKANEAAGVSVVRVAKYDAVGIFRWDHRTPQEETHGVFDPLRSLRIRQQKEPVRMADEMVLEPRKPSAEDKKRKEVSYLWK